MGTMVGGEERNGRLNGLSDTDLIMRLRLLVQRERRTTLELLVHLIEVDRRRLYLGQGSWSLFDYCTRQLGYSESAAARRIRAARCIRDFPAVYEMLAAKELTISTVCMVARVGEPGRVAECGPREIAP